MSDDTRDRTRVTLDLDPEDLACLEAVAAHEKLTKSDTLRRLIRAEARRITPGAETQATTADSASA